MSQQETLEAPETEPVEPAAAEDEPTEKESVTREYIVFVEHGPDMWRRLDTVVAGDPASAVKTLEPDATKRYAVVSARFWQVGKPQVTQITQVAIEFE